MYYYLQLQFTRFQRFCIASGIHQIIALPIIIALFIAFSFIVYLKTKYAPWLVLLLCIYMLLSLTNTRSKILIKAIFTRSDYLKTRLIENLLISFPFFFLLLYHGDYFHGIYLLLSSFLLIFYTPHKLDAFTIPTPFYLLPYEYIQGFRKSILFLLLLVFIFYKAISVDNYNLGLVAIIAVYLIGASYYVNPENKMLIWIYNKKSPLFLTQKIKDAFICSSILIVPFALLLMIYYPDKIGLTLLSMLASFLFIVTVILAKYAAFPNPINLPQFLILLICIWFPPFIVFAATFFYLRAKRKIEPILL